MSTAEETLFPGLRKCLSFCVCFDIRIFVCRPAKFIHMLMTVARNANMAPVVIYMDEVEKVFVKGKKKSTGPDRFLKDLLDYKKRCRSSLALFADQILRVLLLLREYGKSAAK